MTTPDVFTSPTHLTGKVPNQITSSGKYDPGLGPKGTIWIDKGQQADGSWLYWRKGYTPPVPLPTSSPTSAPAPLPVPLPTGPAPTMPPVLLPAPTPPVPASTAVKAIQQGAEVFLQSSKLAAGINASGTLGTAGNAPDGILTAKEAGYVRLGIVALRDGKVISGEAMLKGLPVEGYAISYNGNKLTSFERIGLTGIPGKTEVRDGAAVFSGAKGAIAVEQLVRLAADGDTLAFDVTLRNVGKTALTGLRYMRVIDPDLDVSQDVFGTANKVADRRSATASASGLTLTLASDDPRASANVMPMPAMPSLDLVAALKAAGYSHKGDDTLHLIFDLGTLAAGAETSFSFSLGIK